MSGDLLTAEQLRALYDYDAATGVFTKKTAWSRWPAGRAVGAHSGRGYQRISIDGRSYYLQRLAWLHYYGQWPEHCVDHINGDRADNRIANLRDVSNQANLQNTLRPKKNNKTGYLGVCVNRRGRYVAQISVDGRVEKSGGVQHAGGGARGPHKRKANDARRLRRADATDGPPHLRQVKESHVPL